MTKVYVTSDWHLDASTAGSPRFDDVLGAARGVVDRACADGDLFLFLGDLADPDSPSLPWCVAAAVGLALRLSEAGVPSRWVVGNHDVVGDGRGGHVLLPLAALRWHTGERVGVYADPAEEVIRCRDGSVVRVVALPHPCGARVDLNAWLSEVPPAGPHPLIVAGHLTLDGALPGGEEAGELSRGRVVRFPHEACRALRPAIALNGHHHRAGEYGGVVVPGSLERITFAEEGQPKGYLLVNL